MYRDIIRVLTFNYIAGQAERKVAPCHACVLTIALIIMDHMIFVMFTPLMEPEPCNYSESFDQFFDRLLK